MRLTINHNRNHHVCLFRTTLLCMAKRTYRYINYPLVLGDVIQYHMCFLSSIRDIAKWYRSNNNTTLCQPLLFIITATLLVQNTSLGASAVLIASIISNFYGFIIAPIQYRQVIIKHKKGIWIK